MTPFFQKFRQDAEIRFEPFTCDIFGRDDITNFISNHGGSSFNKGIYRLHSAKKVKVWSDITASVFPAYKDVIRCFGYDWLGRQFAVVDGNENLILMLDVDTGDVLEIPVSFDDFHNVELVDYGDDALAENAFDEWIAIKDEPLKPSECVSYETPLHLGGKDELCNRESMDMRVHWELSSQILDQIKPLNEGQRVEAIKLIGSGIG
jgi:hypothetical protein